MIARVSSILGTAALLSACGGATAPSGGPALPAASAVAASTPHAVAQAALHECGAKAPHRVKVLSGRSGSSIALVETGGRRLAFIADEETGVVRTVDAESLREIAVTPTNGKPAALLPLADGRVIVTLRDTNRVAVFEVASSPDAPIELRCSRATYAEPFVSRSAPTQPRSR